MTTIYKSHGNQQPSLENLKEGSTTIPGGGVEPSGSKREASVKADGEIVCSALKNAEGRGVANPVATHRDWGIRQLQHDVHGHSTARPGYARQVRRRTECDNLKMECRVPEAATRGRGEAIPFPTPLPTLQPGHGPPQQWNRENGCAQSAHRNPLGEVCFSCYCTRRSMERRCRRCIPLSNRRDQGQTIESPSTGQHPVDIHRQPCTSTGTRSTAPCRNNYTAVSRRPSVGGV